MVHPSDETRRSFLKLTGVALGAAGLSGTATSDVSASSHRDWPTFQYDAGNTGFNPIGGDPGPGVWIEWSEQVSDRRLYAPTLADDTVYVGDASGTLTAFDTKTRETRWTTRIRGLDYAPTVVGDTVFVTGTDVLALSTADGNERWRFEVDTAESSPITATDGTLFFKTSDVNGQGTCWAIDTETGAERWHVRVPTGKEGEIPSAENVPPAVVDGVAYFTDKESVYALDAEDGTPQWRATVDGIIDHAPTVADGTVYVCGESVIALSATDGRTKWTTAVDDSPRLTQSPAVTDGSLIVTDGRSARTWSLDCDDGTTKWSFDAGEGSVGTPTIIDGTVYIPISGDDRLVALDVETGERCWKVPLRDLGGSWLPATVGNDIYVTDRDGFLYSIADPAWLDWRADERGTLAVGENVYVANGELVALGTDGAERWTATGNEPTASDKLLYAIHGTGDDEIVAYAPDGSERWRVGCEGEITTEPVVSENAVFVGGDGWVGAFDAQTGNTRWTNDGDCGELGSVEEITAHNDRLFALVDGRVVAVDSDGKAWSAGEDVTAIACDERVYAGTEENEVVAYALDGTERWRTTLEHGESVTRLVADGSVYAITTSVTSTGTDRREWLASVDGGETQWTFHPKFLPFGTLCRPVVAGETVYVGASDRRVYALSTKSGEELRRFETGGKVESVAVGGGDGGDRRVYASSDAVYAFR